MQIYLQWVRRFRAYCQQHQLDEASQLTRSGVIRFTHAYIGPRTKGPVAGATCRVAWKALHGWACALRALRISVPPWRAPRVPARLSPVLAAYCQYRRSHGGVAETTLRRDREVAQAFLALVQGRGKAVGQATVADLDAFVAQLSARLTGRSVADCCSALRAFLRFLRTTGRLGKDLAPWVVAPRLWPAERPPRALPWADVRRILRAIPPTPPPGRRDFAMLLLMATYGLGAAEVLGLHLEDVEWQAARLRVRRPKTGARLELPLLPPVARALAAYLQAERPPSAQGRRIFVRTLMPFDPLTSGAIRHRIRHYARQAGIGAPVIGAHAFRHSHASRQIDAGANVHVVGAILGHRRPSSTSVYVRVALRRLRAVALPVPR
jgi:integrase/recombinase XerD